MPRQFSRVLPFIAILSAGCVSQAALTGSPESVDTLGQQAAAVRQSCRGEVRQLQLSGAPRAVVAAEVTECNDRVNAIMERRGREILSSESAIAGRTLDTEIAARRALENGQEEQAIALLREIDGNGPAIIAEVRQKLPPGPVASTANTLPANLQNMDMSALLSELARSQRIIGQYFESRGQYPAAMAYYEKANATMAVRGGRDILSSILLGFMYAHGRGVQQNPEMARQFFGGGGEGFLGLQGSNENVFAYLLRIGKLPARLQDVTPEFTKQIQDQEVAARLPLIMLLLSGGGGGGGSSRSSNSGGLSCLYAGPRSVVMGLGATCGPYFWG